MFHSHIIILSIENIKGDYKVNDRSNDFHVSANIKDHFEELMRYGSVKSALNFIKLNNEQTTMEQIELTQIPAPTFKEEERANYFKNRFIELGLSNVQVDHVGNVIGERIGKEDGPNLVVSAHLDTVFPEGTDVKAKIIDGKVYAPGIADDGRGLAALLTLIAALNDAEIDTVANLIFVATVGEEGLGDLRGVKYLFTHYDRIDGFISIEPGSPEKITYLATGSRRYQVTYRGPGGHSFGDFGLPSAVHALGRAIALIADLKTPIMPKTTFNVGTIKGGTSVNTIAQTAEMMIDLRSTSEHELLQVEENVLSILYQVAELENKRWGNKAVQVEVKLVGERPAGSQSTDSVLVQAACAAANALGFTPELDAPSSTDSNIAISLGIPAVTLGGGGDFGGVHTLNEYFDSKDAYFGIQKILLTVLGLVGLHGYINPLLHSVIKKGNHL